MLISFVCLCQLCVLGRRAALCCSNVRCAALCCILSDLRAWALCGTPHRLREAAAINFARRSVGSNLPGCETRTFSLGRSVYVHNRLPLSMCVAHPMWVATTLRGIHTNGHDAHPDHRHHESWAYEVPHLTPGHVGHRRTGQLPLAGRAILVYRASILPSCLGRVSQLP